jgi:phosphatidylinositol 4-kinase B
MYVQIFEFLITDFVQLLTRFVSCAVSGLKRFEDTYETPTTPKSAVERLVNSVMEQKQGAIVPNLSTPDLLADDVEGGADAQQLDDFEDAKEEEDDLQVPLRTIDENASLSGTSRDELEAPSTGPVALESPSSVDVDPSPVESSEPAMEAVKTDEHESTTDAPTTTSDVEPTSSQADAVESHSALLEPDGSREAPVDSCERSVSHTEDAEPRPAPAELDQVIPPADEIDPPSPSAFVTPVKRTEEVSEATDQSTSPSDAGKQDGRERAVKRGSKKKSTLGGLMCSPGDTVMEQELAPTGDVRREVLTAIMMRGIQGKDSIAAGAADSVQRSLKELERQRATELLLTGSLTKGGGDPNETRRYSELDSTRDKLMSLGIGSISPSASADDDTRKVATEEDEVMEAIRLLLIQNRVAQGQLSEADAALVLQHTSLSKRNSTEVPSPTAPSSAPSSSSTAATRRRRSRSLDRSEMPTIDAGDVDPRLVGCGALPPAILQALTLWKAEMVSNAELLELVKKDLEFLRHSVLHEAENMEKLHEDSAFWGRFAFGERWAEKKSRIAASSPEGSAPGWDLVGVIVKSNDDLRQESFVMQLIELCQEAFEMAGLELWVNPYRILATGRTTGVIEMVRNAMSFDALKKRPGYGKGGLREHLHRMTEFTADPGDAFKSAQQNFVRSLAAYSLLSYLFQFKDRHNGNLLLDTAGHVIHIDFGFVFGVAPGGSFSLEMSTPFKLTEEMLDVMGGLKSPLFSEFVTLFCCGFLALQPHAGTFLTIVEIMCRDSTFKCFEGRDSDDVASKLRERFAPDLSKEETVSFALDLIRQAVSSYGTKQYDMFQYLSQGIAT